MFNNRHREVLTEAESVDMQLETALKVAVEAHFGQRDKDGRPYVFHPLRVAAGRILESA